MSPTGTKSAQHAPRGRTNSPDTRLTIRRRTSPVSTKRMADRAAFVCLLLTTITLLLRPTDWFSQPVNWPLYEGLILAAVVLAAVSLKRHYTLHSLKRQPISLCMLGLLAAAMLSHLSHSYLHGAAEAGMTIAKVLVYYSLIVCLVDTPRRFHQFLTVTAASSGLMVSLCVVDYLGLIDLGFINHLNAREGIDVAGNGLRVMRLLGTGIFHDPNDMAMLIVATGVMCWCLLTRRRSGAIRWAWLVPLAFLAVGLVLTRSRGGLLAGFVAVLTVVTLQYGKKAAVLGMIAGGVALPLLAGRQGEIDLGGGTGHERILLWREGLTAMCSSDALFGIGQGTYNDLAGLVAHNSFVHTFVELGLFGGTLFFGCFFFAALGLHRMASPRVCTEHSELARLRPYMAGILTGWCVSMLSLSRCYVPPTYMVVGMSAAYLNLVNRSAIASQPLLRFDRKHVILLATSSMLLLASLFVVVKMFAR